ncbi:hypothetical protein FUT87_02430 [Mitsuaria sp. TWR114]|uniref:hypothetical protein n=1 Tax=Mitsuaria sp. TWR114 TaxID=2601731 RepID=UPI0011BFA740|nr:hypothetical protein [Mitsuaria sp. TWR114]TXD99571.1 hypothetical protein FUT87_02430 [Mitsuaria sp. TWR114]
MLNKLKPAFRLLSVIAPIALTGCAGVDFYQDKALTTSTGIPIYGAKPYLLVARTGAEAKPVESSIIYITDPSQVIYAKPNSGFGSAKLSLSLSGGQMTTFGQETDTKIPEMLTSVAGLITARAGAAKTAADAAAVLAGISTKQAAPAAKDVGEKVAAISKDISASADKLDLIDDHKTTLKSAAVALSNASSVLTDPTKAPQHEAQYAVIKAQCDALGKLPKPTTAGTKRDVALQKVQDWVAALGDLVKATEPAKEAQPDFELYEIVQDAGKPISLRRVMPQ